MNTQATLSVKNYDEFQHYKDRTPPWIKLYNALLDDYDFCALPDPSKFHLVAIWLLASRSKNRIPHDAKWIANKISATKPVDIDLLISAGFLIENQPLQGVEQDASTPQAKCLSRERGRDREDYVSKDTFVNGKAADATTHIPIQLAFDHYNIAAEALGLPRAEKLTHERKRKIRARLQEHGIEGWDRALVEIERSEFLRGGGDKGWRAALDFLLQPSSFNKVLEGGYSDDR